MAAFGRKRTLKTLAFCQRECPLSGKADIGLPEIFRLLDRVKYFLAALFQRKYYRVSFDSMLANQLLMLDRLPVFELGGREFDKTR
jgi:hypothetical protein